MLQTILGSSGIIGTELARELNKRGEPLRLVSRKPQDLFLGEQHITADLLDPEAVRRAVSGSEVVYLTAGLPYDSRIWKVQWPKIIQNTIEACRDHKARLVFFDNLYLYGPVAGWMTEETPTHATSAKGKIRAALQHTLLDESEKGNLDVRIARCADFYGPHAKNGIPNLLIFANLAKGQKPQWMASGKFRHSLTYTKDAARATAALGLIDRLPNGQRIWHLPTAPDPLTAEELALEAAKALSVPPKPLQTIKPWMIVLGGMAQREIKEMDEMLYQYDRDYLFASTPFETEFEITPTPYAQGILATAESYTITA
jgi:nucleoside-diphosphate-sugar epimerase